MSYASLVMSWMAIVSLVINPLVGIAIDHFGGRNTLLFGLLVASVSTALFAQVQSKEGAFIVSTFMALANAINWPSQTVCITRVVAEEVRQKVFAYNFMALNLGIGVGGLFAALIIKANNLHSFQTLYRIDASMLSIYLVLVLFMPSWIGKRDKESEHLAGSYREVFRIRILMRLMGANLLLVLFGYASISAGMPLFITSVLGETPKWLGIIWAANCFGIILVQPFVLRRLEQIPHLKALSYSGLIWAFSWLLVALTKISPAIFILPLLVTSAVIFGIGETIWSPTTPTVVNDLAPDHIRGRTNAFMSLNWGIAGVFGAPFAGILFDHGLSNVWLAILIIGCLVPVPMINRLATYTSRS